MYIVNEIITLFKKLNYTTDKEGCIDFGKSKR